MSIYFTLFWEFFKTGLFAIGGGMATLPFLSSMAERFPWLTQEQLAHTRLPLGGHFIVLALSRPSAIVLGIVAPLVFQHIFVRFADKIFQSG